MRQNLYTQNELYQNDSIKNNPIYNQDDYYPYKTTRNNNNNYNINNVELQNIQNDNCLSLTEDEKQRGYLISSPLSSMRFGDEQRKILLDGKRNMDNFNNKFSEDDDFFQMDFSNAAVDRDRNQSSSISKNKINKYNTNLNEFSIIEDRSLQLPQNDFYRNNSNNNNNNMNPNSAAKTNKDKRKHSLFMDNLVGELQKFDDYKTIKSSDQNSQYDLHQLSLSPTKNQQNLPKHILSLIPQNSQMRSPNNSINNINVNSNNININTNTNNNNNSINNSILNKDSIQIKTNNNNNNNNNNQPNGLTDKWKKQSLIIIYLARKFIVDVKKYSSSWRFKNLSFNQFQAINDVSCDQEGFTNIQSQNIFSNNKSCFLISIFQSILQNKTFTKFIIPDSPFKLLWDCFILMLLFINIFYIPIKLCFTGIHSLELNPLVQIFLYDIPGWSFLADTVVRANTAFYQRGQLITQKSKILLYYYKQSFFLDLIIIIPFFISLKLNVPFLDIIFLLRINRLMSILSNFESMLNLSQKRSTMFSLVKLAVTMIYVAHFCGSSFFYVGTLNLTTYEEIHDISWVHRANLMETSFTEKYTTCLYWATITMITVGYGDIIPLRTIEKQTVLIITILSCGVYAYSINVIGIILQEMTKENQIFKKKMSVLQSYMKKRGISNIHQQQIKKYFNYMHEEDLKFNEGGDIFFNEVKGELKTDILSDIYYKILNQSKLFRMNFTFNFLKSLSLVMEEQKYVCDEVIMNIGDECQNLYFVSRGEVQSLIDGGILLGNHQKGSIFDEIQFFRDGKSDMQYKSNGITTIVYVKKENFVKILQKYPKDYEKYCMMRDKIILYSNLRNFEHKCQLCYSFKHTIRDCLFVNPIFNNRKILYQHNKVIHQERNAEYHRSDPIYSFSELKENVREVRDSVIQYLIDRNPFEESANDLLNLVQFIVEYDTNECNQYKPQIQIPSAQLINDNLNKQMSNPEISSMQQLKKISLTNFQELENDQYFYKDETSPIQQRKSNKTLQNRIRKGSSFSSVNNDSMPQESSSSKNIVSQTPHSLHQQTPQIQQQSNLQNQFHPLQHQQTKNYSMSDTTSQQFNIQLYQAPLQNSNEQSTTTFKRNAFQHQHSRQKNTNQDDQSLIGFSHNNLVWDSYNLNQQQLSQQDYVLVPHSSNHQDRYLHIPSYDVTSNNLPMNNKKINSFNSLNSQKIFLKQTSKSSYFANENNNNNNSNNGNNNQQQQINSNQNNNNNNGVNQNPYQSNQQQQQQQQINSLMQNNLIKQQYFQEVSQNQIENSVYKPIKQQPNDQWYYNLKDEFMVLLEFDKYFNFQIYCPESNLDKVLIDTYNRRKTIQNQRKQYDTRLQEDKLKQIRSNLHLNKERSKYKHSTRIKQSSHMNHSYISFNQINQNDVDQIDKINQQEFLLDAKSILKIDSNSNINNLPL